MGFTLYHGPEIDDDKHVFTMLNFAADHPARDMQDTFFISQNPNDVTKNVLLRSHTSGDEAHYMESHEPPIRVLCPGRVYRNEAISARAHCFFHQVEGLYVDKGVRFACARRSSRSPSQAPRWTSRAPSAVERAATSASTLVG